MSNPLSAMLDELMGRNRNSMPSEGQKDISWDDPEVCPYYIAGYCPHDLFINTKADLGICPKIHDEKLRQQYKQSDRYLKSRLEDDFLDYLQRVNNDMRRKIDKNKQRLELTQPGGEVQDADKEKILEKLMQLNEKITALLSQAEQLGAKGEVEEAQGVVKMMEELTEERDRLQKNLDTPLNEMKQMEVCDVCGCFLILGDVKHRLDEHYLGKQHTGFSKIRNTIEELLTRKEEQRKQREEMYKKEREEREKLRVKKRHGSRDKDQRHHHSSSSRHSSSRRSRSKHRSRDRSDKTGGHSSTTTMTSSSHHRSSRHSASKEKASSSNKNREKSSSDKKNKKEKDGGKIVEEKNHEKSDHSRNRQESRHHKEKSRDHHDEGHRSHHSSGKKSSDRSRDGKKERKDRESNGKNDSSSKEKDNAKRKKSSHSDKSPDCSKKSENDDQVNSSTSIRHTAAAAANSTANLLDDLDSTTDLNLELEEDTSLISSSDNNMTPIGSIIDKKISSDKQQQEEEERSNDFAENFENDDDNVDDDFDEERMINKF